MIEQLTLAGGAELIPASTRTLTSRQQAIVELVRAAGPGGVTVDEVGALIHARLGRHSTDTRCRWDGDNGAAALRALRARHDVGLRSRRDGTWYIEGAPSVPKSLTAEGDADGRGMSF